MSQPTVLQPSPGIDFNIEKRGKISHYEQFTGTFSPASSSPSVLPVKAVTLPPLLSDLDDGTYIPDILIPSLPPLQSGDARDYLRNMVMQVLQNVDVGTPDAENAFFIADLSEVIKQHMRWKTCLPEIEPFYGTESSHCTLPCSDADLQLSSATPIRTC
jgi:ornithine decarboxylase